MLPPPLITLQVTPAEETFPQVSEPAAVKLLVAPAATVGPCGEMVSVVGVPGITVTLAVPWTEPLVATIALLKLPVVQGAV